MTRETYIRIGVVVAIVVVYLTPIAIAAGITWEFGWRPLAWFCAAYFLGTGMAVLATVITDRYRRREVKALPNPSADGTSQPAPQGASPTPDSPAPRADSPERPHTPGA